MCIQIHYMYNIHISHFNIRTVNAYKLKHILEIYNEIVLEIEVEKSVNYYGYLHIVCSV